MPRLRDTIDRTPEYINFIKELKEFHASKGTTLQAEPVLGGRRLDLYKIFQVVINSGGFDEVTKNRGWKQVGDIFQFPSTCTNSAYILKGVYIRNLLGWEEEKLWKKSWDPPKELLGPNAHRSSTLAGKSYKPAIKKTSPNIKSPGNSQKIIKNTKPTTTTSVAAVAAAAAALLRPLAALQQLNNPLLLGLTGLNAQSSTSTTSTNQSSTQSKVQKQNDVFSEKDKILFALQFGQRIDVEWALDQLITISFECPEKLEINNSPFILNLLVSLVQPYLASYAVNNALPTSAIDALDNIMKSGPEDESNLEGNSADDITNGLTNFTDIDESNIILKTLHIIRNFSLVSNYTSTLVGNSSIKEFLIQLLETSMSTGRVDLGRHSIDILENIAIHMELESTEDPCLQCLYKVVTAQDRYLTIGSIRALTYFIANKSNHIYLESCPVMSYISQMLLSSDEELVGTVLEYIYQYTRISTQCRTNFLIGDHASVYIGHLVSLLLTKSKYFTPKFIQNTNSTQKQPGTPYCQNNQIPRVPDLTVYQNLDEPFRCLGWLKDKFEIADRGSIISIDDIYLLYESRFALEKALKMRDFYTVMTIAFPKTSSTETTTNLLGGSGQLAPTVDGLNIVGIQIKTSVLNDRQQVPCKWSSCTLLFDSTFSLLQHILNDHTVLIKEESFDKEAYACNWSYCNQSQFYYDSKDDFITHLRSHMNIPNNDNDDYSSVHSPEPSLSSTPSTPTSSTSLASINNISSTTVILSPKVKSASTVDNSNVQGIALVACYMLEWLSKDPHSADFFILFENDLNTIAEQRPKLTENISSISANIKAAIDSSKCFFKNIDTNTVLSQSDPIFTEA